MMQNELALFNKERYLNGEKKIEMEIGIHTGPVKIYISFL